MKSYTDKINYVAIITCSYIFIAIVLFINQKFPASSTEIGNYLGMGFGFAILPLLGMLFFSKVTGWIIFVLLSFGYAQGELNGGQVEKMENYPSPFVFQGKGCGFSVTFPSEPVINIYTQPQFGDYEEAVWTGKIAKESTFLRTECIPIPSLYALIGIANEKNFLLNQLAIHAKNNGLSAVEYQYSLKDLGPTGSARGVKHIQGIPVTYRIDVIVGEESLITLYAGGLSSTFPSKEVLPFLDSVFIAK